MRISCALPGKRDEQDPTGLARSGNVIRPWITLKMERISTSSYLSFLIFDKTIMPDNFSIKNKTYKTETKTIESGKSISKFSTQPAAAPRSKEQSVFNFFEKFISSISLKKKKNHTCSTRNFKSGWHFQY
ncbi:hypothetical protein QS306_14010 [Paraburkholderia bonniea]|uniref:hypothetical protein n=1 Tax=Paraburkholderia bonniea TaxID=2152891 RepID=UPI002572ADD3|nr:hypothetical protein [Paraburkholderia bonniea]WJF91889.1 hypothetical protein QS306_14010 [Paraburkholderia bonniea]WJF95208.1 hypothetical protein QS308_14020 [Paraburkholderia bonniea]